MAQRIYNLEERLIQFAVMILNLAEKLPQTYAGKHLGGQVIRSGTSPALQYGEAQAAESDSSFTYKMKSCLKELRETQINLKIIKRKPLASAEDVDPILQECSELVAIFTTSVNKLKGKDKIKIKTKTRKGTRTRATTSINPAPPTFTF